MTRQPAPDDRPVALTIAGSDSGGGAGIQADLKTMEAEGVFGTSVVTAVTAQNTQGVSSSHVLPIEEIDAQLSAVRDDFDVRGGKTGMLATADVIETVTEHAADAAFPLVVDPVMVATSGDRLLDREAESAYEDLIAEARVVTPNADEAEVLTGIAVEDGESARDAGEKLLEMGAGAALVKGGHVPGDSVADTLVTPAGVETFTHRRVEPAATHGSGCMLAAAIASQLAMGADLTTAVESSTDLLNRAVRYHLDVGEGPGAVHHMVAARNEAARYGTEEAVYDVVERLVDLDVSPLVPEVGMNVVGATPYAETVGETAAVEGRITRTMSGVNPNRGVRFGASSHVARFLLAAREYDSDLRFAVNCRFTDEIEEALGVLDGEIGSYDRREQPEHVRREEGSTMQWAAHEVFEKADGTPVAVTDPGAPGKESILKFIGSDLDVVVERIEAVLAELE